ncbi:hypothetical protein B0J13DRAFT_623482 [Dactylonectria estremocensis]|uniref:Carrier domain-containing protein n=1 Tax=Dactylonectria estremocensis TaxID=1079267 RepID=A0A9P9ERI4_9HYPO|nr:hypothetical protein B0J13DRAFT_623482 [Dactylonectria estremocensis]
MNLRRQVVEKYEREHRQVADKTHVSDDAAEIKRNANATSATCWEQPDQFGRADLNSWKQMAGRGKSWRRLKTNGRPGSSKAIHVQGLGRSGILQIQVVRSQLPATLLKTTPATIATTFSDSRIKRKPKTRLGEFADEEPEHHAQYGAAFINHTAAEPMSTSDSPVGRFLFRYKTGKRLVQDRFYDLFAVEDLDRQHFHLVGLVSTEEDHYPSVGFVVNNFHIRVLAMSYGVFDGLWRLIVVGKKLEEPSPFNRYTFGTLYERVRRYCDDFPKPGKQPDSVTGDRSDSRLRTTIEREELVSDKSRAPETVMETRPQAALAEVLQLPTAAIGCDASFLRPGGDSFAAMSLIAEALSKGLIIMAKGALSDPSLARLKEQERKDRRQGKQRRKRARKRAERHGWKAVIADVE